MRLSLMRYHALQWGGLAILVLAADFFAWPYLRFPILYLLPVSLAAWLGDHMSAFGLAVGLPLIRLSWERFVWHVPRTLWESSIDAAVRVLVFVLFAALIARLVAQRRALQREVRILTGILPICSVCKKIRDEHGEWRPLEDYLRERSEASFTHGLCPQCARRHYGEFYKE